MTMTTNEPTREGKLVAHAPCSYFWCGVVGAHRHAIESSDTEHTREPCHPPERFGRCDWEATYVASVAGGVAGRFSCGQHLTACVSALLHEQTGPVLIDTVRTESLEERT